MERRGFLAVERAQADEIVAAFAQLDVGPDEGLDIGPGEDLADGSLVDAHR
jgi:hypothetical protein